jgi:hypothetical protein
MPCGAAVETKGLKSWVIEVSGELSITSVFPAVLELPEPVAALEPDEELLDEQAARPAASRPTAVTASTRLLLLIGDLSVNIDFPL